MRKVKYTDISQFPAVLTVADVQEILRCGRKQAYELFARKEFYSFKVGKCIKVSKEVFIDWLHGSKTA